MYGPHGNSALPLLPQIAVTMHCLHLTLIVSCLVLLGAMSNLHVAAQGTTAICKPEFSWMSNSLGQSPCLMAAFLGSVCSTDPSSYIVGPTAFGYHLPTTSAHDCTCNTVAYSLFSACALCQTQVPEYGSWSSWITNCTDSFVAQYPRPLPTGTAIPVWAFFDVTGTSEFNATVAQAIAIQDPSEISATSTLSPNSPSNTSPPISASSLPLFASQTFSSAQESPTTVVTDPNSHSSHSGSKKHVGAIVGGVVGGVAFLASLAGAALLLERRQRSSHRPRPAATAPLDASAQSHSDVLPPTPSVNEKGSLLSPSSVSGATPNKLPSNARLYDPNDPSTFPDQVVTPTQSVQRGGYAGYPEL